MSGMDRLTDEALDRARRALDYYEDCANQLSKGGSGSEGAYDSLEYDGGKLARDVMAEIDATMRELLAHRRASQAQPTGTELLPCPFCGDNHATTTYTRDGRLVVCTSCGAKSGNYYHGPKDLPSADERAIAAWNRRASQAAPAPSDGLREEIPAMPETDDRKPWDEAEPDGYYESNREWADRNDEAVQWMADNHTAIRAALTPAPAQEGGE